MVKLLVALVLLANILGQITSTPTTRPASYLPAHCDYPLAYTVDRIDRGLGVNSAEFRSAVAEAERRWEMALGEDIFTQKTSGLRIRLLNDGRKNLENHVWDPVYDREMSYQKKLDEYDQARAGSAGFLQQLRLYGEAHLLYREYLDTYDSISDQTRDDLSLAQGIYDYRDNTISVYYFDDREDLIFTLEHELGHALGLEHNLEPDSVMIERTTIGDTRPHGPSTNDVLHAKLRCAIKPL